MLDTEWATGGIIAYGANVYSIEKRVNTAMEIIHKTRPTIAVPR